MITLTDGNTMAVQLPGVKWQFVDVAMGQNQWYHFGVGAAPIFVCFSGDWDVHWGYGFLTHRHVKQKVAVSRAT